jgi:lycopene cyclase domain-containing protein
VNYTVAVLVAVAATAAIDLLVLRTRLLCRRAFWTAYGIVLVFQLVVNGVLTGLRIVRYDPHRIVGVHIAFAPIEDLAFGFAMVLLTLTLWVWAGRRASGAAAPTVPRSAGHREPPGRPAPR